MQVLLCFVDHSILIVNVKSLHDAGEYNVKLILSLGLLLSGTFGKIRCLKFLNLVYLRMGVVRAML